MRGKDGPICLTSAGPSFERAQQPPYEDGNEAAEAQSAPSLTNSDTVRTAWYFPKRK